MQTKRKQRRRRIDMPTFNRGDDFERKMYSLSLDVTEACNRFFERKGMPRAYGFAGDFRCGGKTSSDSVNLG